MEQQQEQREQQHDDVDLLLECTQLEAIELMADDPKYYLGLVENYRTRRDGSSVHLPYELNTNVNRRPDGGLIVQFKLNRDGRWYEVGYDGKYTDEDVYLAFTEKVKLLLKYPPPERSHLCEQALGDPSNAAEYAPSSSVEKQPEVPPYELPVSTRDSFAELLKNCDSDLKPHIPSPSNNKPVPPVDFSFFKPTPQPLAGNAGNTEEYIQSIIDLIRTTPEKYRDETDKSIVQLLKKFLTNA
jgi:hypothetical protein